MRRKTVDCYLLNNLLDYNYLESIKEQETLIILLIKVSLVCLKIKFRTRCPIHLTHWKAIPCDNNYNNKSGPDWKLPSPCPSYGRPDPQCQLENGYGQWELTNGRVPLIAPPFNQRGNVAYAKPEQPAPCSRSSPVTQRTAD